MLALLTLNEFVEPPTVTPHPKAKLSKKGSNRHEESHQGPTLYEF
jgi:hypothetical protein